MGELHDKYLERILGYFEKASIIITDEEKKKIEIVDFGRNDFEESGLSLLTYVNTDRCCAKELILFPNQCCAEHRHPTVNGALGKEETFRCRWGKVYLYVEGDVTPNIGVKLPKTETTVCHEIQLNPGEQYTLAPNTKHWFKGGEEGAVVSEFSTKSTDEADIFTDKTIVR